MNRSCWVKVLSQEKNWDLLFCPLKCAVDKQAKRHKKQMLCTLLTLSEVFWSEVVLLKK